MQITEAPRLRLLVAYGMESTFAQTTRDYLEALKKYTHCDVSFIHVTHDAILNVDLEDYDIVFQNYCSRLCFEGYVSEDFKARLRHFSGVKVLSVQDEYNRTDVLKAAIKDIGFDVVLTCVPKNSIEYVYPRVEFPSVEFVPVLTGYVSDDFISNETSYLPLAERPILIGYRGRQLGANYGELGYEKFEIGRKMKEICVARGLSCDIAMDEGSRIYGRDWFTFIGNCRAMLGSESGSNVFDFDGAIEREYQRQTVANGGVPPDYSAFKFVTEVREREIEMGQISPRIFEYALMRTPMILFRGKYSGALQEDTHYIPLEKDFSNVDAVLKALEDLPELRRMADRAYEDLVRSGKFGYRAFGKSLRALFDKHLAQKRSVIDETLDAKKPLAASSHPFAETPTPWPQTHHAFRAKQMHMRGVNDLRQIAMLEALYTNAIKKNLVSVVRLHQLAGHLEKLAGGSDRFQKQHLARLIDGLHRRAAAIQSARSIHEEKLETIQLETMQDTERNLFAERLVWIGEYANNFNEFQANYASVFAQIEAAAEESLNKLRGQLSHVRFALFYLRFRALSFGGARLEFAKSIARRSRVATRIALVVMGLVGKA